MSADPLGHKVPRHVPGEQYEKAYGCVDEYLPPQVSVVRVFESDGVTPFEWREAADG